jgi:hypothetical protein
MLGTLFSFENVREVPGVSFRHFGTERDLRSRRHKNWAGDNQTNNGGRFFGWLVVASVCALGELRWFVDIEENGVKHRHDDHCQEARKPESEYNGHCHRREKGILKERDHA